MSSDARGCEDNKADSVHCIPRRLSQRYTEQNGEKENETSREVKENGNTRTNFHFQEIAGKLSNPKYIEIIKYVNDFI